MRPAELPVPVPPAAPLPLRRRCPPPPLPPTRFTAPTPAAVIPVPPPRRSPRLRRHLLRLFSPPLPPPRFTASPLHRPPRSARASRRSCCATRSNSATREKRTAGYVMMIVYSGRAVSSNGEYSVKSLVDSPSRAHNPAPAFTHGHRQTCMHHLARELGQPCHHHVLGIGPRDPPCTVITNDPHCLPALCMIAGGGPISRCRGHASGSRQGSP
jgi:hypothetical protein